MVIGQTQKDSILLLEETQGKERDTIKIYAQKCIRYK